MHDAQCPKKTGLPSETVKWLQSLHMSFYPRNVRRDFSSGYLMAEIFSHYYPQDFSMHSYDKGTSLSAKQWNWSQIQRKQNLHLMKEAIYGTVHCKPGAAELLVQQVYGILTNHSPSDVQGQELDFTDQEYQSLLPSLARSTASKSIKNNLTITEIMAKPDVSTNQMKAEVILFKHLVHKRAEKVLNPERFKVKSNRRQLTAKYLLPSSQGHDSPALGVTTSKLHTLSTWSGVSFKEITVHQPARHSQVNN
ncbi:spermatogenesis-associated protein 4 isoform X2 [Mugil cephalus]|uniref:spermatogenesis-associated protein 4 isoform X2 n=1 Tax=Mugil cephalus TaxID=48193 RepID=UPI001FB71BF1|nr:spermatogenesis-associated protein 4 isoform X2 [Mugil cephalus]